VFGLSWLGLGLMLAEDGHEEEVEPLEHDRASPLDGWLSALFGPGS
jgi:hypothetical protein